MNKELFNKICKKMPTNISIEDMEVIEVDGNKYHCKEVELLDTTDEGKYQYGGSIYAIGVFDEEYGYGIIGEPLFFVEQNFTQTGSYYSYQEREYEEPYMVERKEKVITVWEAI